MFYISNVSIFSCIILNELFQTVPKLKNFEILFVFETIGSVKWLFINAFLIKILKFEMVS